MPSTEKQQFFRCLLNNDVPGLIQVMDDSSHADWVLAGIVTASRQSHWECLNVLLKSPSIVLNSEADIRDCCETVLFESVARSDVQCVQVLLDLIDTYGLHTVAKEALRRCASAHRFIPNALKIVQLLLPYSDNEQKQSLLHSSVNSHWITGVEFFAKQVPLALNYGDCDAVGVVDVFPYLVRAGRNAPIKSPFTPAQTPADLAKWHAEQHDVLNILLHGVDPDILAQRLKQENQNKVFDFLCGETHTLLYDWIEQQHLKNSLEQAVEGVAIVSKKRKV